MRVYFHTLGCKVNAVETDSMAALLEGAGYLRTDAPAQADVIVINSCTVTASGDARLFKALRRLRAAAPDAVIVLTGCYVQAFPEEAQALTDADIFLGTKHRSALPELLAAYFAHPGRILATSPHEPGDPFEALPQGTDNAHTRAFLKIQDGCNRFCTYCIIPYARGRSRSREAADLQCEAQRLYAAGFRELVLCGINLACWGQEWGQNLADAVALCAAAGFPRIRLGSLEPDGLTDTVLERLARIPALCPQFHISVQSGCDRTLAAMHRHYTCAAYAKLLSAIRSYFPGAAITTDLMVGFPGESEEDFGETMRFAQEMAFSQMHIFRYSPRPGTKAASDPAQIPEAVKKQRADRLSALAQQMHEDFLRGCIGTECQVLFERERGQGFHRGHAAHYALVCVPDTDGSDWRGQIRRVWITGIRGGNLTGELL